MVLGIGEGSIDIVVDRTSFHRGEAVRGKVVLKLSQPKKARGLRISLIAERDVWRNDRHGRNVKQVETVFSNPARLDGEKEYAAGEASYDFELAVPNIGNRAQGGMAGAVLGAVATMLGNSSPVRWRLESSLGLPMSLDINRRMAITVV